MNNSLLDELAVCCCCHKPLDARPWEEEGRHREGHDRAPSDMCSLCYQTQDELDQTEDELDQDVFYNMTSTQGHLSNKLESDRRTNSRLPEVSCSDFDLRELDESVEMDLESSEFFANPMLNSTMNITQAWVMGADTGVFDMTFCEDHDRSDTPLRSASGRKSSEKQNLRTRREAVNSQDSSSIDSGITSGFDQDTQQLSTLEAEIGLRSTDLSKRQEQFCQRPETHAQGSQVEEGETPLDIRPCSTAVLQISRGQECSVSNGVSQMDDTTKEQIRNIYGLKNEIRKRIPIWEKSSRASEEYSAALLLKEHSVKRFLTERAKYLHSLIDRWYGKTTTDLETTFAHERDAVSEGKKRADDILQSMRSSSQEAESLVAHRGREQNGNGNSDLDFHESVKTQCRSLAARMCSLLDAKVARQEAPLCVVLNRGSGITPQELGSISVLKARRAPNEEQLSQKGPFLVYKAKHLRSFETRKNQEDAAEFMATGLALTNKGRLLVADQGVDSVKAFDTVGRRQAYINILPGSHQSKAVQLHNGNFAVACKNDLKFFIKNGEYWKKLGQNLYSPQSVTLDPDGNVAVCDVTKSGSTVVRFFDKENFSYLRTVELTGPESHSVYTEDHRPWYLCITGENNIIVTDFYDHTVKAFTKKGKLLWSVGGKGAGLGQFFTPAGLCVDSFGHILVADCLNDRIHILSPAGEFLAFVVSELDGVERPTDVTVDRAGNLWVLQAGGQVKGFQYLF